VLVKLQKPRLTVRTEGEPTKCSATISGLEQRLQKFERLFIRVFANLSVIHFQIKLH